MKKIFLIACLLTTTTATFAECLDTSGLRLRKEWVEAESNRLSIVADYLQKRFKERRGDYEGSRDIGSLMLETRKKSLQLSTQAAQIEIVISEEIIKCNNTKKQ